MKLLYITQWFEPEPILKGAQFASALARMGHDVDVVTAFPNYPGGKLYEGYHLKPIQRQRMDGFNLIRLPIYPSHNSNPIGRIANYLSFFASVLVFGLLRGYKYDAVYVYHPPITPSAAAAVFCRLFKIPLILDVQDLWPDSVVASNISRGRLGPILTKICNFVYRQCAHIICQSEGMRTRLLERGVSAKKLSRLYNWSTYNAVSDPSRLPPSTITDMMGDRVNLVYGGNIGDAQSLRSVIDAVVVAHERNPELRFHIIGDGIEREELGIYIRDNHLDDVVIMHRPVERSVMDRIFDLADILVLQLRNDPLFEITIPSKLQHYMSCGKPILAALEGEAKNLINESGSGFVTSPEDSTAMAASLSRLLAMKRAERVAMGEAGRRYYEKEMAFESAITFTVAKIRAAVAQGTGDTKESVLG